MENFTQIPNCILDDKELTLQEKALLCIILRNSDEWKCYKKEIASRSKNGRDSSNSSLDLLAEKNLILKFVSEQERDNGRFTPKEDTYFKINKEGLVERYENLSNPIESTADGKSVTGIQSRVIRYGFTVTNNTNTNNTNTNNTKENNTNSASASDNSLLSNKEKNTEAEAEADAKKVEKKNYFFQVNERPGFHKIEEYFHSKGYSSKQAEEMWKKLLSIDFKTSTGPIKFLDSFFSNELKKIKPDVSGTEIEKLSFQLADRYTSTFDSDTQELYGPNHRPAFKTISELSIEQVGLKRTNKLFKYLLTSNDVFSPSDVKEILMKHSIGSIKYNEPSN